MKASNLMLITFKLFNEMSGETMLVDSMVCLIKCMAAEARNNNLSTRNVRTAVGATTASNTWLIIMNLLSIVVSCG